MRLFFSLLPNWNALRSELNEQLFASKYRLVLPSEDELRAELEREHKALQGISLTSD